MKKTIIILFVVVLITLTMIPTAEGEIAEKREEPVIILSVESATEPISPDTFAITANNYKAIGLIKDPMPNTVIEYNPSDRALWERFFPEKDYDKAITAIAKVLDGECEGVYKYSKTNCAGVVETILNRVDAKKRGKDPESCATADDQFAYVKSAPVRKHFVELSREVMGYWLREKAGIGGSEWRVLPSKDILYFYGKDGYNHFGNRYPVRYSTIKCTPKRSKFWD